MLAGVARRSLNSDVIRKNTRKLARNIAEHVNRETGKAEILLPEQANRHSKSVTHHLQLIGPIDHGHKSSFKVEAFQELRSQEGFIFQGDKASFSFSVDNNGLFQLEDSCQNSSLLDSEIVRRLNPLKNKDIDVPVLAFCLLEEESEAFRDNLAKVKAFVLPVVADSPVGFTPHVNDTVSLETFLNDVLPDTRLFGSDFLVEVLSETLDVKSVYVNKGPYNPEQPRSILGLK